MSITTHSEYSGSFDSAYTVNTDAITTGGPALSSGKSNIITEAKWMGPCKPDQKPGDMIMPVGNPAGDTIKMNICDIMKGLPDMMKAIEDIGDMMKAKGDKVQPR
jgi:hypothetical protein